jgi:hypothetical protein
MMCDPVSLGIAAVSMSAIGTGISAYGQINQGNAAAAAAKYNAQTSLQEAQGAEDAARINEQQTYKQGDELLGRARAAMGANGVDVNAGTALLTQGDIEKQTETNVSNQSLNANLQAWGYRNQATLDTAQAGFDTTAGNISAAGTLIGGASQVAGKWANLQSAGFTANAGTGQLAGGGPNGYGGVY